MKPRKVGGEWNKHFKPKEIKSEEPQFLERYGPSPYNIEDMLKMPYGPPSWSQ